MLTSLVQVLEDLIVAATNDGIEKAKVAQEEATKESMEEMMKSMDFGSMFSFGDLFRR